MSGHVARVRRGDVYTGYRWGNLRERDRFEDLGLYGRIILKWILRKWGVRTWAGLMWLRIGTGGEHL